MGQERTFFFGFLRPGSTPPHNWTIGPPRCSPAVQDSLPRRPTRSIPVSRSASAICHQHWPFGLLERAEDWAAPTPGDAVLRPAGGSATGIRRSDRLTGKGISGVRRQLLILFDIDGTLVPGRPPGAPGRADRERPRRGLWDRAAGNGENPVAEVEPWGKTEPEYPPRHLRARGLSDEEVFRREPRAFEGEPRCELHAGADVEERPRDRTAAALDALRRTAHRLAPPQTRQPRAHCTAEDGAVAACGVLHARHRAAFGSDAGQRPASVPIPATARARTADPTARRGHPPRGRHPASMWPRRHAGRGPLRRDHGPAASTRAPKKKTMKGGRRRCP